ncbi:MAG TPA: TolC family protein [Vicinamibacterales bacterium]
MNRWYFIHSAAAAVAVCALAAQAAAQGTANQAAAQGTASQGTVQLTLADAVQRAVEHNPDLAIVRLDTEADAARVGESRGAFAPVFSTQLGHTRNVTPPTSALVGATGLDVRDWFSSTGVRQRLPWGAGTWSVSVDAARTTTNNPFTSFDPNLASGIQLAFSQPLLRDRRIDESRAQYVIAKRNQASTELRFRESVVQTVATVKEAYWTLEAAIANVGVQQRSLELAQELARQNRIKVDAGQTPPLDLVQSEAEIAQRRQNLIQAKTTAEDAEDHLRRLIMDPGDQGFWNAHLDPTEAPPQVQAAPDADAAVARAMAERSDLTRAQHDLDNATTSVELSRNQTLPDVRLETSYRGNGLAGRQLIRTGTFPGIITGSLDSNFGNALGQAFGTDYPAWSVGVTVNYPIGRSFEQATLARAEVERRQASERIASLRLDAAESVRRAARQVRSTAERVEAARAGATLAEERYHDEQRRYDVGLSTTFLVTQAQRDLLQAQVDLLQSTLDHQSALVSFEAVQQAPSANATGTVAIRGADIVLLPTPAPRGLFRPGAGQ